MDICLVFVCRCQMPSVRGQLEGQHEEKRQWYKWYRSTNDNRETEGCGNHSKYHLQNGFQGDMDALLKRGNGLAAT